MTILYFFLKIDLQFHCTFQKTMSSQSQEEELPFIGAYTFGRKRDKTAYLHKPPTISPNYGKPLRNPLPKTYIARVILFENSLQQNILESEIKEINWKIRRRRGELYKKRFTFIDDRKRRQKIHEMWETGYQRMKTAYIKKYGTKYMPVPTPEPEENPFFINARLIPPLNVLYFYLDSLAQEETVVPTELEDRSHKHSLKHRKSTMAEYARDHERLIKETRLYSHSVEDPRFRNLEGSLIPPYFKNDGYLQLSPGYHPGQDKVRIRKWSLLKHRAITLPKFYTRPPIDNKEPTQPKPPEKDSTFPLLTKNARSSRYLRRLQGENGL